ncbi:1-acyl-sn-glycerol-3-phosphate acyltransferase [Actinoallomurus sp. NPDC050550]|uniref:1-acyl-sn-glycerol-3-phosphate acyltransferase n=1 Tax=Actinoallomurus sp. NPDC050550 TaxID=3154937 RepID=UPI0033EC4F2C
MDHSPVWRAIVVGILRPLLFTLLKRDWKGQDNIPRKGGVIIAVNHLSWSDPLALAHFIYRAGRFPVYLAKAGVFKTPVIGRIIRRTGQIPVYRERSDAALALRDAEKGLRGGECVIFYPEGTCTRDPDLWPMAGKTGAARMALTTGVPVIPVAHWGAHILWPYGTKKFRPFPRKTMHVIAGPPVDLSKYEGRPLDTATLNAATADIMRAIADLLGELRGEPAPEKLYDQKEITRARRAAEKGDPAEADASRTDEAEASRTDDADASRTDEAGDAAEPAGTAKADAADAADVEASRTVEAEASRTDEAGDAAEPAGTAKSEASGAADADAEGSDTGKEAKAS